MRRLIAAAVLLILVAASFFGGYFYINRTCDKAEKLLENCLIAYEQNENPKEGTEKLEKYWSEKENVLSIFANHAHIDEIEAAISSLNTQCDFKDNKMFYEYYSTVKTLLHQMMEDTAFGMHSIL
ncbi:MAG: DUF4363 family protein [Clostridia bacterium]|nr:DUF4363 family protein [Clostridia bacterium]